MRFNNFGWILIILIFVGMFLLRTFLRWCVRNRGCRASRFHKKSNHDSGNKSEAIEILNERYANGELNSEEYKLKKEEILRK